MAKPRRKAAQTKRAKKSESGSADIKKIIEKFVRDEKSWKNFPDKHDILLRFFTFIGAEAAKNIDASDRKSPPRDQIFNLLMLHLDQLRPYKKFIKILRQNAASWPILLSVLLRLSSVWLNDLNLQQSSWQRCAWIIAFIGLYKYGLWLWLSDHSADSAKTMAGIDRLLVRIDMISQQIIALRNKK